MTKRHVLSKRKFAGLLPAALFAALLAGCGGGGGTSGDGSDVDLARPAEAADVAMRVVATDGRVVAAAKLQSAMATSESGDEGAASVSVPVGNGQVVKVSRQGFAEQIKVLDVDPSPSRAAITVVLAPRGAATALDGVEVGGSANGRDGVAVRLPAAALVDPGGTPVVGRIDVQLTPVDVTTSDVGAFPGRFEGVPESGGLAPIASYGVAELWLSQNGSKLQVAPGKVVEIDLPLYATRRQDGSPIKPGDAIALWSLDTSSGLWNQEGVAKIVASSASPTGLVGRASISHFSWWNLDSVSRQGAVNLTVTVPGQTIPQGVLADVTANVVAGSGPSTAASMRIAPGTSSRLSLPAAPTTIGLSARVELSDRVCTGRVNVSPAEGVTVDAVISAPCTVVPVPRINPPANPVTSTRPIRVEVVIDGPSADRVELLVDGGVIAEMSSNFAYVFFIEPAPLREGSHTVTARATRDGASRSSQPITIVVDRTPPHATAVGPDPSLPVTDATTFTVDFSEAVVAAPFDFGDLVKLSVAATPNSDAREVPITLALDATARRLTVTPRASLGVGRAAVSWLGLRDVAGNGIAGVFMQIWDIERALPAAPPLSHLRQRVVFDGMASRMAVDSAGALVLARRPEPGDQIIVSRFDAAAGTWQTLGPAVNDRPTRTGLALALDGVNVPYVALTQEDAAGTGFELVVRRLSNGAWQTLGAPLPIGNNLFSSPVLLLDSVGSPWIGYTDATSLELRVANLQAGSWVHLPALGALVSYFDLVMQPNGWPAVLFTHGIPGNASRSLDAMAFDGTAWLALGATLDHVPNATQMFQGVSMVWTSSGPVVAWKKDPDSLKVAQLGNGGWALFPPPSMQGWTGYIDLAVRRGDLVLAAADSGYRLGIQRFIGGAWEPAFYTSSGGVLQPQLVVNGSDVFLETNSDTMAFVVKLLFP
jgi:hypothetical protein